MKLVGNATQILYIGHDWRSAGSAQFWQTKLFAIMTYVTIQGDCIDRVTAQNGDRVLFEGLRHQDPHPSTRWRGIGKPTAAAWAAAAAAHFTHRRTKSPETDDDLGKQCRSARWLETHRRSGPGTWKPEATWMWILISVTTRSAQMHSRKTKLWKKNSQTRIHRPLKESKLVHIQFVFAKIWRRRRSSQALFEIDNVEVIELKTSMVQCPWCVHYVFKETILCACGKHFRPDLDLMRRIKAAFEILKARCVRTSAITARGLPSWS